MSRRERSAGALVCVAAALVLTGCSEPSGTPDTAPVGGPSGAGASASSGGTQGTEGTGGTGTTEATSAGGDSQGSTATDGSTATGDVAPTSPDLPVAGEAEATTQPAPPPGDAAGTSSAPPQGSGGADAEDPRVAVVDTFTVEFARAATEGDPRRPGLVQILTESGYDQVFATVGEDIGLEYPGPVPFTVTQVVDRAGGAAVVEGCIVASGFALTSGQAIGERVIMPVEFHLVPDEAGSGYLIDALYTGNQSCDTVPVEAEPW